MRRVSHASPERTALVSGLEGANRRFDLDYWSNMMPEAVTRLEHFLDEAERDMPRRRYTVGVCAEGCGVRIRLRVSIQESPCQLRFSACD